MTSMFDQYEQASQRSKQVIAPPIRPDIVSLVLSLFNINLKNEICN